MAKNFNAIVLWFYVIIIWREPSITLAVVTQSVSQSVFGFLGAIRLDSCMQKIVIQHITCVVGKELNQKKVSEQMFQTLNRLVLQPVWAFISAVNLIDVDDVCACDFAVVVAWYLFKTNKNKMQESNNYY